MILRYMAGCSLILAFLIIEALWTYKSSRDIALYVRRILLAACVPVICQMVITMSNLEELSRVTYSAFFISVELLLYQYMSFIFVYTKTTPPKALNVLRIVMCMDIVSIIMNIFTGHAGVCVLRHYSDGGKPYYAMDYQVGYYCHLFVSYVIVVVIIAVLLRKIVNTARMYWVQYLLILGSLVFIVLWNVVYAVFHSEVDYSVIGYALSGILIFYFSLYFRSRPIISSMLATITRNLASAIVCYDADGSCIYQNDRLMELLKKENKEDALHKFEELLSVSELDTNQDQSYVIHEFHIDNNICYIEIKFQRLKDRQGKILGSFYELSDRTKEMSETRQHVYLSTHDELTGLHNERWLFRRINIFLRREPAEDYYVIVYDIVNFKVFNDNFGRDKGDEVLRKLAETLKSIEEFDARAISARISGGKFAILISKDAYNHTHLGERIEEMEFLLENVEYPVYVHAGIYDISQFGVVSADVMIDRATFALASINQLMGSRIVFYDANMKDELVWNQTISAELNDAMRQNQIYLCIQPQVDKDGKILGGEALVRWNHPVYGMLTPDRFLPVFERNGFITLLDTFMWHEAAALVRKWEKQGIRNYISVNISPVDIDLMDVYEVFTGIVKDYGINPRHLNLEITETMVGKNIQQNIRLVERLKKFGFSVEMDDFGSGYSSLNMLKDIPVEVIKMDMKFLQDTGDEERSKSILASIFEMTKKLGLITVAEGVETAEHVALLEKMGCDVYQGYYFSKPLTVSEFEWKYFGGEVEG